MVEAINGEVNDVSIELFTDGVLGVEDVGWGFEDGQVDQVGSARRVVVFTELGEGSSVWGMELGCSEVAAGIQLIQAGHLLADGREGLSHSTSCHRFVLAAILSVAEGTDEHTAVAQFWVAQALSEGAGDALLVAERDPVTKGCFSVSVLGGVGLTGKLESRLFSKASV